MPGRSEPGIDTRSAKEFKQAVDPRWPRRGLLPTLLGLVPPPLVAPARRTAGYVISNACMGVMDFRQVGQTCHSHSLPHRWQRPVTAPPIAQLTFSQLAGIRRFVNKVRKSVARHGADSQRRGAIRSGSIPKHSPAELVRRPWAVCQRMTALRSWPGSAQARQWDFRDGEGVAGQCQICGAGNARVIGARYPGGRAWFLGVACGECIADMLDDGPVFIMATT